MFVDTRTCVLEMSHGGTHRTTLSNASEARDLPLHEHGRSLSQRASGTLLCAASLRASPPVAAGGRAGYVQPAPPCRVISPIYVPSPVSSFHCSISPGSLFSPVRSSAFVRETASSPKQTPTGCEKTVAKQKQIKLPLTSFTD